jgi:hypothetical protein
MNVTRNSMSMLINASAALLVLGGVSACGQTSLDDTQLSRASSAAEVCEGATLDDACARGAAGNSCADAIPLAIGTGSVVGTTVGAQDHGTASGSCSMQAGGLDRIYTFTLAKAAKVSFDMLGNSGYDTVLHLRTACANPSSQVACNDDHTGTSAGLNLPLQAGTYFLFADSYGTTGGGYTLNYTMLSNPCDANPCGNAVCAPTADWASFTCTCPAGQVLFHGTCIADPCNPNPCTEEHMNRCIVQGVGQNSCQCNAGFLAQDGGCVEDPNLPEWTWMVYLNADNNLEGDGYDDLHEMQAVGSTAKVNIVVLMDTTTGDGGVGRKLYVTKGGATTIASLGEIDMGVPQTLADFGTWVVDNYPARHYALVMWDHGSGWDKAGDDSVMKGFSWDDSSGNHISVAQGGYAASLAPIVEKLGRPLDIVGFDACLMAMWEVANASAPYANYLIASEETEPAAGWSYDKALAPLIANPGMTALELATKVVDTYYGNSSRNATLSVTDLGTMEEMNGVITAFADELLKAAPTYRSQIESVRGATQKFYYADHRDLSDFASRIAATSALPASLKDAAKAVQAQVAVSVPYFKSQASGYAGAKGMAINIPATGSHLDANYGAAMWSALATWDEFLAAF